MAWFLLGVLISGLMALFSFGEAQQYALLAFCGLLAITGFINRMYKLSVESNRKVKYEVAEEAY